MDEKERVQTCEFALNDAIANIAEAATYLISAPVKFVVELAGGKKAACQFLLQK